MATTKKQRTTATAIERTIANAIALLQKLYPAFEETLSWPEDAFRAVRTILQQQVASQSLDCVPATVTRAIANWAWVLDYEGV